jgi:hypothetical protein
MSQQAVSADFQIQLLEYFPQNQKEQRQTARVLISWFLHKFRSLYFAPLATLKSSNSQLYNLHKNTTETESEVAEKSSWGQSP